MKKIIIISVLLVISLISNTISAQNRAIGVTEAPYPGNVTGGSNSGIVGKTNGSFEVYPNGSASYSMPIVIPVGSGGLTPQLSISYNSFSNDGILGWGFSLNGLSVISRALGNRITDGMARAVTLTESDYFALDGNRLKEVRYSYNGDYYAELNDLSKVKADTRANPMTFTVNKVDGTVLEYGGTNDSRLKGQNGDNGKVIFWLLNKVTDINGNYYTVSYGQSSDGDYWPERIDYTGNINNGLLPYASIRFEYSYRNVTNIAFVNNSKLQTQKLLKKIRIYNGNSCIKTYQLDYNSTTNPLLTSVTEIGSDGVTKYNPTSFAWYTSTQFIPEKKIYDTTSLLYKANLYPGDFNGDGKTDFIATPKDGAGWTGWRLFLANASGTLSYAGSGTVMEGFQRMIVGDFDGDGKDDVVQVRKYNGQYTNYFLYTSTGTSFTYYGPAVFTETSNHEVLVGDFNSDGAQDFFIYYPGTNISKVIYSQQGYPSLKPLSYITSIRRSTHNWERGQIGDFNGDGIADVLNLHKDGYDLQQGDGYGTYFEARTGTWPQANHHLYFGDFNGDGKTDMLATGYENYEWSNFQIHLSTGTSFERHEIPHYFNSRDKTVYVADINGDGKDDFYAINKGGDNMAQILCYVNNGNGLSYTSYSGPAVYGENKWEFHLGDYNGDGKTDYIASSTYANGSQWSGYQLYCLPSTFNHVLNTITDGLGNKVDISYKFMTDNTVHTQTVSPVYPIAPASYPIELVSTVKQSNGIGGYNTTNYLYRDGMLHKQGRGFLGFGTFIVQDADRNLKTTYTYEVNGSQYLLGLKKTVVERGTKLLNSSEYTNQLFNWGNGTYTFCPTNMMVKNYDYSSSALASTKQERKTFDSYGNITTSVVVQNDKDSIKSTNTYYNDQTNWLIGRIDKTVSEYVRQGMPKVIKAVDFEYSSNNVQVSKETVSSNGSVDYSMSYLYDGCGNRTSLTKSSKDENRVSTVMYDENYRFKKKYVDAEQYKSEYYYDTTSGVLTKELGADGLEVFYEYDAFMNPYITKKKNYTLVNASRWSSGISDAPSNAVYFAYKEETGSSPILEFYDSLGRLLRKKMTVYGNKTVYIDRVYNSKGELVKESEPYFAGETARWISYSYDDLGRLIKQLYPDNTTSEISYTAALATGLKTVIKNRLGQTNEKYTNVYNELIKSVDNAGNVVNYSYNSLGKCLKVTGPRTSITMGYDNSGNRISLIDPDCGTYQFKYNAFGELIQQKQVGVNAATDFEFDKIGRVVKRSESEGITVYSYNSSKLGLITSITNGTSGISRTYHYDDANRVTEEISVISGNTYSIKYEYDNSNNQITRIVYPNGYAVKNLYDNLGNLEKVTNNNGSKILWKLSQVNSRGAITSYLLGNGISVNKQYDAQTGYLTRIQNGGLIDNSYKFDALGNLVERSDLLRKKVEKFEYDNLNRLIKTNHGSTLAETIGYDTSGNILTKSSVGNFAYISGTNRIDKITVNGYSPVVWDEISYTSFQKVSKIKQGSNSVEILYGVDQERSKLIQKKGNETKEIYYVGKLYEEEKVNGIATQRCFIFADDNSFAINSNNSENSYMYLHKDHLGSILGYSNDAGSLQQEFSYDSWGRRRNPVTWAYYESSTSVQPLANQGFCEHEHIDLSELINMNGRMYDPVIGRFISPDPFVQAPGYSQNLNRYTYCLNNPLTYKDESGEFFIIDDWIIGGIKGLFNGDGFWKSANRHAKNAIKIWGGLFALDSNKSFLGKSWEFISRFTYQGLNNTIGFVASHLYNTFGNVLDVDTKFGATVLTTTNMKNGEAFTMGSWIIGDKDTRADPNNSTFQHEYGHYLQSQAMGWAYFSRVAFPSLLSASKNDGKHRYRAFESDANYRAFKYFNKNVTGFYTSPDEWNSTSPHVKGWDFKGNPLVPYGTPNDQMYVDYANDEQLKQLKESLSFSAKWYNFFMLISPFESQDFNGE